MKSITLLIAMVLFSISVSFSQTDANSQLGKAMEKLSKKEKAELLGYALSLDGNLDKKLKKALKKLSDEQKGLLVDMIATKKKKTAAPPPPPPPPPMPVRPATASYDGPTTTLEFKEMEYDFGEITSGDVVEHVFQFTNTGKEPLVITKAKGSCGCTVPKWPKEPVLPGETAEIEVKFNSKNKQGNHTKNITITANTQPVNTIIRIKAKVLKADN